MVPLQQIRRLSTIVLKTQLFCKGIQSVFPKSNFLPATWYLGKTLVTSNAYFKNDKEKSKLLVNHNEAKANKKEKNIAEKKEPEEEDEILILVDPKTKRYKCTYEGCSKSFANQSNLNRHIKDKHLKLNPHKCHYEGCSKSFVFESELKRHINESHLKPFKCDTCDKGFGTQKDLDQHISEVHLKLKPFECDVCGECFAQKATLDNHKAIKHEEGLKLVPCTWPGCSEKFKNSKELATHFKKFHVVTDHQCHKCKMYCTTKRGLNLHIDKCEDNRNFKCTVCGAAFTRQDVLDAHMKHKHSDERNYVCEVEGCGQAFKSEANLRSHMKSHCDKMPHQCPYCKKAYKRHGSLQTHVFKKHPEEYKEETNNPKVEE